MWATENIKDASRNELYFAWGETQGYTASQVGTDKNFVWQDFFGASGVLHNDYEFGPYDEEDSTNYGMTKYNNIDNKTVLDTTDDAAIAKWGSNWKMPTKAQFEELIANTTTTWTQVNGVNGMLFTSTVNGNTLFFPANGAAGAGEVFDAGVLGCYWSVSLNGNNVSNAWNLYFENGSCNISSGGRCSGYPVRPVRVN